MAVCDRCGSLHMVKMVEMDDGLTASLQSIDEAYSGQALPPNLLELDRCLVTCTRTGSFCRQSDYRKIYLQPFSDSPEFDADTAIAVLEGALNRCRGEDMRTPEVFAALDFLELQASSISPFNEFRNSLDIANEERRWQNANASLNAVKLALQKN
jgi:hypothetical protein